MGGRRCRNRSRGRFPAARMAPMAPTTGVSSGAGDAGRAAVSPRVSVVVPLYRSQETLESCLAGLLAQDYPDFEVIAVDSSPDEACAAVLARHPEVRSIRSRERLLPHAARNLGVERSTGELLLFTDPDIYAPPDWLRRLVAALGSGSGAVASSLACHGGSWLDRGIHWTKFSKWAPGGAPRPVDVAPTAGLLCRRSTFEAVGGLPAGHMLGDALFSWRLRERGATVVLVPEATAEHHHVQGLGSFVRERFVRGIELAELRLGWEGAGAARRLGLAAASLLPLRLASNLLHVGRHAARAGRLGEAVAVSPLVALGFVASLGGEALGALRSLRRLNRSAASDAARRR